MPHRERVKARLVEEKSANLTRLGVVSRQAVVRLTGTVSTEEQKALAERVAKSVSGVQRVVNALDVARSQLSRAARIPPLPQTDPTWPGAARLSDEKDPRSGARRRTRECVRGAPYAVGPCLGQEPVGEPGESDEKGPASEAAPEGRTRGVVSLR